MFFFFAQQKGFNPGQLSSCVAWYDLSSSQYLILSSTAITQTLDRSGNGNDSTVQGTSSARPTFTANQQNGLSTGVFDGGDFLDISNSAMLALPNGDSTIFAVANSSINNAVERIVNVGSAANGRLNLSFSSVANTSFFNNGGTNISVDGFTKANYNILTGRRNGATLATSVNNGAEQTNATAISNNDSDMSSIGSTRGTSQFLTGGIGEIVIYNRSLTSQEIGQVNLYLARKWNISI